MARMLRNYTIAVFVVGFALGVWVGVAYVG